MKVEKKSINIKIYLKVPILKECSISEYYTYYMTGLELSMH